MKIGVISDTHIPTKVKKIPKIVFEVFEDVDLIIHAGDIVEKSVLNTLAEYAPVKAVSGNIDPYPFREELPDKLELSLAGYEVAVIHGHNVRGHIMNTLGFIFPEADIIIFGHTHRPCNQMINNQLHFNPGSATDRRMQKKHSIGIINLAEKITSEIIEF